MRMLVYADEGVGPFSLQETLRTCREFSPHVERVDAQTILREDWWERERDLLIFPGGRDVPYRDKLGVEGAAKIRNFVERRGGNYLGICAGAYFGSGRVVFEKGGRHELLQDRELKLFPGSAVGTLYRHCTTFDYDSERGTHAAEVSYIPEMNNNKEDDDECFLHLYYNGGCTFDDVVSYYPSVRVLATYRDVHHLPEVADDETTQNRASAQQQSPPPPAAAAAAVIHCRVGKGNAILSGVHFEMDPYRLEEGLPGCPRDIVKKLKASNDKRKAFISFLMEHLTTTMPT